MRNHPPPACWRPPRAAAAAPPAARPPVAPARPARQPQAAAVRPRPRPAGQASRQRVSASAPGGGGEATAHGTSIAMRSQSQPCDGAARPVTCPHLQLLACLCAAAPVLQQLLLQHGDRGLELQQLVRHGLRHAGALRPRKGGRGGGVQQVAHVCLRLRVRARLCVQVYVCTCFVLHAIAYVLDGLGGGREGGRGAGRGAWVDSDCKSGEQQQQTVVAVGVGT